tara:strand:- start:1432 stop:3048 length:1617 start_codon:yes stop_codon:yes gene_type:complete
MKDAKNSQSKINKNEIKEKQAIEFIQTGKLKEAEEIYQELVAKGTLNHVVYGNLAAIYQIKGEKEAQINLFKEALKLKHDYPQAHYNLGNILKEQGDTNGAIDSYQQAIKYKHDYPQAHYNLGNTLKEKGDLNGAIASYQQALKYKHDYPEAHCNLGVALEEQGDLNGAIASCQQALKYKHDYPEAHCNLGVALEEQGDLNGAIASYQQALRYKPDYPEALCNLGQAFLSNGEYQKGWLKLEYRFKKSKKHFIPHAQPPIPQWQGEVLDSHERLLVVSEQGLGDTIQFMRYIPYLRQQGIDVSFCAQIKLHNLIKVSGITSNPLTPGQGNNVKEGKWIPLLSVPQFLDITPENPIITQPYIQSSNELTNQWNSILSTETKPIIGINWQGNPKVEINNLKGRSIPLENFSLVAKNLDYKFLSLQKGFGSEQLKTCSFKNRFVHCQDQINITWDFLETAAIIANCDLVITSDTSVAHLAAGMGKTTWCLLHYVPEWRWGQHNDETFWYPSMKLFRQQERNNWLEVIERVSAQLLSFGLKD